jgi:TolB-like protein/DNA-binding winged helix-turn-helix (wHTH) protein/Flp pilus assembly protein TadD
MDARPSQIYQFDDFRVDAAKRQVWRSNGAPVPLTPRVFDTLLYLVQHSGAILEKDRLMDAVWPDAVVEENNLSKNISTLRRVFGESPGSPGFILTVPGHGYRFVAEVSRADNTAAPVNATEAELERVVAQTNGASEVGLAQPSAITGARKGRAVALAISAVLVLALAAFLLLRSRVHAPPGNPAPTVAPSEKSIAVLPFGNLSADQENAFFIEGMQEDILTALAKVADLKVISRTSVASYVAGSQRNLREIGQELGVSQILEGSVRRAGDKVRVTVQLIDARTNMHIWAETYDRNLADVFAIQSEIAQKIAAALKAKLAPDEKALLDLEHAANSEAYVLYLTALGKERQDEIAAEQLYVQAAAADPGFALAYARASLLNSSISLRNQYRDRKAKARAQAEEALRLSPTLAEAHMALGLYLYWDEKMYDAALKEFEIAAKTSPNNARIYTFVGGIYRRQGRWREAMDNYERARSLDPRNISIVFLAANNHRHMRDWPAATAGYTRALELDPDHGFSKMSLAYLEVYRTSNPTAGRKILAGPDSHNLITLARCDLAMLERDYVAAENILSDIRDPEFFSEQKCSRAFFQGQTALARGDIESAQRYFVAAASIMEGWTRDDPNESQLHAILGLHYAYMQRKEDAIREARRAVELEPESRDAFHGPETASYLALVYALTGEQDKAITLIEHLLTVPGLASVPPGPATMTLADLRLRWEWDALRSNPRFQKILAGPEPKTVF